MIKKLLATALLTVCMGANAADKALLIGVGEYRDPRANLPGIDLDVTNMKQVAKIMGFSNIKTLQDSDATESNIKKGIRWLSQNVSSNDRVLLYFSGHGSQTKDTNGDEKDNLDEMLIAHDFSASSNGRVTGVIIDDYLNKALKSIPSKNVYVLIDACNSGTATKGATELFTLDNRSLGMDEGAKKFLSYKGMPVGQSRGIAIESSSTDNFVTLSAAQDNEYAIAGKNGSYFTLGILGAIRKTLGNGQNRITPTTLHNFAVDFVESKTSASNRFVPNLSGSNQLKSKHIQLNQPGTQGEYWGILEGIANSSDGNILVSSNRSTYRLGQEIEISVEIPITGYLNIITVDANDQPLVLFPNKYHRNNKVRKGTFNTSSMSFDYKADDPMGANLTVAIVTKEPLNLYEKSSFGRNNKGEVTTDIAGVDAAGLKELRVRSSRRGISVQQSGQQKSSWAGKLITRVKR